MKDLVLLVADKDAEQTLKALLEERRRSIGIRSIQYDIFIHPERDSGVCNGCVKFLRPYINQYNYALVTFDYEGSGCTSSPQQMERELEAQLQTAGWQDRAAVVVIAPELENWVFASSHHVIRVIANGNQQIYMNHLGSVPSKPQRPKETMRQIMREAKVQWSSALFYELARSVSLRGCTDRAFDKLVKALRDWFPEV